MRFLRRKGSEPDPKLPADEGILAYDRMREMVLGLTQADLGLNLPDDEPYIAIMDWAAVNWVATVIAMAEGSVSFYVRGGQSVIGAGQHAGPRAAGMAFLARAKGSIPLLSKAEVSLLPPPDSYQFIVRTPAASYVTAVSEAHLHDGSPLRPLYGQAQELITQIRITCQRLEAEKNQSNPLDNNPSGRS